uniref:TIL domain containing protein n=1 Tax=Rhipicephalus appendiculatus TaxID=34631 RepID=A0A131YY87_RHIAP
MQYIAVAIAAVCCVVVNGYRNCTDSDCESSTCSELEVPVYGRPRRDRFCRPLFTPPAVKEELRTCVCRKGYVRNSWEECVPRKMCMRCKFQWQKDFRNCASGCPSTCNRADDIVCQIPCAPGCECPPGWKLHPTFVRMCIRAEKCPTKCPPHSSMQECVSTCEPQCGKSPPLKCVTSCGTPSCVCDKGYAEYMRAGVKRCVRRERCARILDLAEVFRPRHKHYEDGGETSLDTDRHLRAGRRRRRRREPRVSSARRYSDDTDAGAGGENGPPSYREYFETNSPSLSPLYETPRVTVTVNDAPAGNYPTAQPTSGTSTWRANARHGEAVKTYYPLSTSSRGLSGNSWTGFGAYPLVTPSRVTAGYVRKDNGRYPIDTAFDLPGGCEAVGFMYYPSGNTWRYSPIRLDWLRNSPLWGALVRYCHL